MFVVHTLASRSAHMAVLAMSGSVVSIACVGCGLARLGSLRFDAAEILIGDLG